MSRTHTRRQFLRTTGAAALAAGVPAWAIAGCGGSSSPSGEITMWSDISGAEPQSFFKANWIEPFNREHPDGTVKVTFQDPDSLDRVTRTALQAGQGPDLVPTPGPSYALEFIQANLFRDLTEYAEQYDWPKKVLPWAYEAGQLEDKLYSIPFTYETMPLYYNATLFESKGWTPPRNRAEFEAIAEEAQGDGIIPVAGGSADWKPTPEWFVSIFWSHHSGPDAVYQALTGELPWTDPVFVDAIELCRSYFDKGWIGGGVQRFFDTKADDAHAQFGDGKAAMCLDGSWLAVDLGAFFGDEAGNENDWAWQAVPPLRDGVPENIFALSSGSTLSINENAGNPDGAAQFIDYLFSDAERTARTIKEVRQSGVPIHLSRSDLGSGGEPRFNDMMLALNQAGSAGTIGYTTWTFWPPKSDVWIYEQMENVLTGDMTAAEYCEGLQDTFEQERADELVPPTPPPTAEA